MPLLSKFLKKIDIYGHNVGLNFDRQGQLHTTAVGGFFSLLIGILISYLAYTNLVLMFTFNNP